MGCHSPTLSTRAADQLGPSEIYNFIRSNHMRTIEDDLGLYIGLKRFLARDCRPAMESQPPPRDLPSSRTRIKETVSRLHEKVCAAVHAML